MKALVTGARARWGVRVHRAAGKREEIETKRALDCFGPATFPANQPITGPQ
jgi:hypothetical protein